MSIANLIAAIRETDFKAVTNIINAGVDVNHVFDVTDEANDRSVLIDQDPRTEDYDEDYEHDDADRYEPIRIGQPILFFAVYYYSTSYKNWRDAGSIIIRALISAGADVNAKFGGWTPLKIASNYYNSEITKLLLESGADTKQILH